MSDDLVTRLRLWATVEGGDSQITDELHNAADEIERLQAEESRLMQIICDSSPDDDYLLVRQEADAVWERIHKDNEAVLGE